MALGWNGWTANSAAEAAAIQTAPASLICERLVAEIARSTPPADDQHDDHRHQPRVEGVQRQMRGVEARRVQAEQTELEREQDRRHRPPEPDRRETEPGRRDLVAQRVEDALSREVGEDQEVFAGEAGVEPGQVERRAGECRQRGRDSERRTAPAGGFRDGHTLRTPRRLVKRARLLNPAIPVLLVLALVPLVRKREGMALAWCVAGLASTLLLLPALLTPDGVPSPAASAGAVAPWAGTVDPAAGNPTLSDVTFQIQPWLLHLRRELRAGRAPYWNPYQFSGAPFWANGQSAPLFPLHLLFVALPLQLGLVLLPWLRAVVAGVGAWALARELEVRPRPALIAAIVFPLSGMVSSFLLFPMANALCLVPWVLRETERLARERGAGPSPVGAGGLAHPRLGRGGLVAAGCRGRGPGPGWSSRDRGPHRAARRHCTWRSAAAPVERPGRSSSPRSAPARWWRACTCCRCSSTSPPRPDGASGARVSACRSRRRSTRRFDSCCPTSTAIRRRAPGGGRSTTTRRRCSPARWRCRWRGWGCAIESTIDASRRWRWSPSPPRSRPITSFRCASCCSLFRWSNRMLHHRLLFAVELGLALFAAAGVDALMRGRRRGVTGASLLVAAVLAAAWWRHRDDWGAAGLLAHQTRWTVWIVVALALLVAGALLASRRGATRGRDGGGAGGVRAHRRAAVGARAHQSRPVAGVAAAVARRRSSSWRARPAGWRRSMPRCGRTPRWSTACATCAATTP